MASLSILEKPEFFNPPQGTDLLPVGSPSTPYRSIAVTNITPGQEDVVATFDVKIGGVVVRQVSLRRGRNNSTYVNYPNYKNDDGKWVHLVEIISPALESAVCQEIYRAVGEVAR